MADKLDLTGITFDPELPEPLYLQLADALHERIKYHTGESCVLPSQRIAASMLQIDRSTAAKAYAELERRKVVSHVSTYKWEALPEARKMRTPFPNIAVVIPRRLSDYLASSANKDCIQQYIYGIIDRAAEQNISTLMLQLPAPDAPEELVEEFISEIAVKVDGAIHLGARQYRHDPPLNKLFRDKRIPQVMISAFSRDPEGMGCVMTDLEPAFEKLAHQLRKNSISRVGVVCWHKEIDFFFRETPYVTYEASLRCRKFINIFEKCGFSFEKEHILTDCCSYYNIYHTLASLIRRKRLPELLFCQNDQIAVWCIQALERQGIRVPEDIAVIGCDNCYSSPWGDRLTSFDMPFYELGCAAVDLIEEIRLKGIHGLALLRTSPAELSIKETFTLNMKG